MTQQDQGDVVFVALAAWYARQVVVVDRSEMGGKQGVAGNRIQKLVLDRPCHHRQEENAAASRNVPGGGRTR